MKYALVTGGSRGIGRAVCQELAGRGYNLIINYVSNREAAEETAALVREKGMDCELLQFDVSNPQQVDAALNRWSEAHPEEYIEVLVNNAGVRADSLIVFMTDEQWHKVTDTTINGFYYVTRRVLKNMLTKRYGRIVTVASLSGLKGLPGQANYSASKAAVIGATKAIAQEVARRGVTVNAVAPGFIATDMTKDLDEAALKATVPMNRFGHPEEVAAVVGFLASPEASYVTGEVISINGGLYS
ncbi:MAG: 3-oxoacyl-ACP reductase FabG [Alistipes sp.]|nr:3-oxoacyl-ACP reductase FabG [Candidatus Minthomonas equi]